MFEKTFKILSNSDKYLNREEIAQALLNYATQCINEPNIFFGIVECDDSSSCIKPITPN